MEQKISNNNILINELRAVLSQCGFPDELGLVLANQLRSDKAIFRMKQYICQTKPKTVEEIADEMISILTDIENWKTKKMNAYYNGQLNSLLNCGLESDYRD